MLIVSNSQCWVAAKSLCLGLEGQVLGLGLGLYGQVLGFGLGLDGHVLGLGLDGQVLGLGLGLEGQVLGLGLEGLVLVNISGYIDFNVRLKCLTTLAFMSLFSKV